jgi:hypothetical protein
MPTRATRKDLEARARSAIEANESWLLDVAGDMDPPQMYDNVKHTRLFREAVMRRLVADHAKYRHLIEKPEGDSVFVHLTIGQQEDLRRHVETLFSIAGGRRLSASVSPAKFAAASYRVRSDFMKAALALARFVDEEVVSEI